MLTRLAIAFGPVARRALVERTALSIALSALCSGLGLFGVGAAITLLTGRHVLYGGIRQLVLGLLAAVLTYGIGWLIGDVTGI
mgnify:CR=1 FL=1